MTDLNQIWKCEVCGNVVEVVHSGADSLVCCGQPMKLQKENTVDAAQEKHVPVIEKIEDGFKVKVGEVPHPMEEAHYIEWIEVISNGKVRRYTLSPGDAPETVACCIGDGAIVRAYCNLHGLWIAK